MSDLVTVTTHLRPEELDVALRRDVREGLSRRPRSLPPKWFYDAAGSELFDQITRLPEYYPTEAERAALVAHAAEIVDGARCTTVLELGSGSSDKTRTLLDAAQATGRLERYVPFDVSEAALRDAAERLAERYPDLRIDAVVGDFDRHLSRLPRGGRRMLAFLGGTIGNYPPGPRAALLEAIAATLEPGDSLLLGTDLVKDPARLVAAYDDAAGVTAEFNRNVLRVVNRELGADFVPERFEHVAIWNAEAAWIEMWLRSSVDQTVHVAELGLEVDFIAGESLLTEISAKFLRPGVEAELDAAGFDLAGWWTDPAGDFALSRSVRR